MTHMSGSQESPGTWWLLLGAVPQQSNSVAWENLPGVWTAGGKSHFIPREGLVLLGYGDCIPRIKYFICPPPCVYLALSRHLIWEMSLNQGMWFWTIMGFIQDYVARYPTDITSFCIYQRIQFFLIIIDTQHHEHSGANCIRCLFYYVLFGWERVS